MTTRIGINGFGRIGRTVARVLFERKEMSLVAVNDLTRPDQMAHGLKYDSVYGRFPAEIEANDSAMKIGNWQVRVTAEKDPSQVDWASAGVDVVIEATGKFKTRGELEGHLAAGAPKVVLCVPPKDPLDATVVLGVNDHLLTGKERLVSNASCTTNAAAPVTKVVQDGFGIVRGYINTIHAYTNDQNLVDFPHRDWRRSRSAAINIIPTSTGAAKAVAATLPALAGKLDGSSYRVPVPVGSVVDMVFQLGRDVSAEQVNQVMREAAAGPLRGILEYQTDPIVSSDIVGNSHSAIFDSQMTKVIDGSMVKVVAWYDNEFGYSNRVVDLAEKLSRK